MGNVLWQWSIIVGIFWLVVNGDGEQCVVVEGVVEGDDFVFFIVKFIVGIFLCQFKGCFVGFGVGVVEKYFVGKG